MAGLAALAGVRARFLDDVGDLVGCNVLFSFTQRDWTASEGNVDRNIFAQVAVDLVFLTLLLYFADLPRNPFLFYFVFHMIIAGMYLRGWAPYCFAAMASLLAGAGMLLQHLT